MITIKATVCAVAVCTLCVHANTIESLITSTVHYASGEHVISNTVKILPGGFLTVSGAHIRVFSSVGVIDVGGGLHVQDTLITGTSSNEPWGWIMGQPGSTVMCERSSFVRGGGHPDVPSGSNYVIMVRDTTAQLVANVFEEPKAFSLECAGASQLVSSGNVYATRSVLSDWAHRSASLVFQPGKQLLMSLHHDHVAQGAHGYVVSGVITEPSVFPALDDGAYYLSLDPYLWISNTSVLFQPGVVVRAVPGCGIYACAGALLQASGTTNNNVCLVHHNYVEGQDDTSYINSGWRGIVFDEGSTGLFSHVYMRGASHEWSPSIMVNDSVLEMTDCIMRPGTYYAVMASNATITVDVSDIQYFHANGIRALDYSLVYVRNTVLAHIMTTGGGDYGVELDDSSTADARFCWWGDSSGPRPYGTGELVSTNAGSVFFPWLIAAPGSQTNPPNVQITLPASEPTVTSDPQAWLEGIARDDGQIVSVMVQNAASTQRVQVMPDGNGIWRAHIWLYEGMNALAVYAYDEQGNVDVDARLVECSGAGVGAGAGRLPVMAPMPNRVVRVGELVRARCVATSPDACVLTYWAVNVPEGGTFDQGLRELQFIPTQAGVAHVIRFYACDGKNVATTTMTVDVVDGDPPVGIRTGALPPGYRYFPYAFTLVADNAVGPVSWSYSDFKAQDGLTYSRAGVISGVPLKDGTVGFTAIAKDTRGDVAASNWFTVSISKDMPTNGVNIPFQQVPVCVSGTAYTALAALIATNGVPEYAWYDASDVLSDIGLAIASNGVISGTPVKAGVHGWLPVVCDQSNGTSYAQLALPVIAPEHQLKRMAGLSKGKLMINRMPGMQTKGNIALKMRFTPPAGFTFDQNSPVVAQVGLTQITVPKAYKYKPGAQLVFKKIDGIKSYSISVKYKPGIVQASFVMKKVNLSLDFEQYGIYNENVLVAKTAKIPVWIRIGDYEMATELMPVQYTTKANKATKGKAAW